MIYVERSGFNRPYNYLNDIELKPLAVNQSALAMGICKVGKKNIWDFFRGGLFRIFEIAAKTLAVYAYTDISAGKLVMSEYFTSLDATERANYSYHMGMGIAQIIASENLKTPWLRHISPLIKDGTVQLIPGSKSQPDLLGFDLIDYHIIEAKGRQKYSEVALRKAKNQSTKVGSVNGLPPATHCASLAVLKRRRIEVYFQDPDSDGKKKSDKSIQLKVDRQRFMKNYYLRFSELFDYGKRERLISDGLTFITVEIWPGFQVGVYEPLLPVINFTEEDDYEKCLDICTDLQEKVTDKMATSFGSDGIGFFISSVPDHSANPYAKS